MKTIIGQGEPLEGPGEEPEEPYSFGPLKISAPAVRRITEPSKWSPWSPRETLLGILAAGGVMLTLTSLAVWKTNLVPYESEWGTIADWFMVGISAVGTVVTTAAIFIAALTYVRGEQDARQERAKVLSAEDEALLHFTSKFRETINTEIQAMTDEASLVYFAIRPVAARALARPGEYAYSLQVGVWNRTGKPLRGLELELDEPVKFRPDLNFLLLDGDVALRWESWLEIRRHKEDSTLGSGDEAWTRQETFARYFEIGVLLGDYVGYDHELVSYRRYWSERSIEPASVGGHEDQLAGKMRLTFTIGTGPEWVLVYDGGKPAVPVLRSQFLAAAQQGSTSSSTPSRSEIKLDPILDRAIEDQHE